MDWRSLAALTLIPLLPTIAIFVLIRRKAGRAGAKGSLFGISFEATGAVATYIVVFLLMLLGMRSVPEAKTQTTEMLVRPLAVDQSSLLTFMQNDAGNIEVVLEADGQDPVRFDRFDISTNKNTLISRGVEVPKALLGTRFRVVVHPSRLIEAIDPPITTLRSQNEVELVLKQSEVESRDWVTLLDAKSVVFFEGGRRIRMREISVLRNDYKEALESAVFNGYVGYGNIIDLAVTARKVESVDLQLIANTWSREKMHGLGAQEVLGKVEEAVATYSEMGSEVGVRRLVNSSLEDLSSGERLERGSVRVDGTSPVVGPVSSGVGQGDGLIVIVELNGVYPDDRPVSGHQDHLGNLFERTCERALLVAHGEGGLRMSSSGTRVEFKELAGRIVENLGSHLLLTEEETIALDLEGMKQADVARVYWVWL